MSVHENGVGNCGKTHRCDTGQNKGIQTLTIRPDNNPISPIIVTSPVDLGEPLPEATQVLGRGHAPQVGQRHKPDFGMVKVEFVTAGRTGQLYTGGDCQKGPDTQIIRQFSATILVATFPETAGSALTLMFTLTESHLLSISKGFLINRFPLK